MRSLIAGVHGRKQAREVSLLGEGKYDSRSQNHRCGEKARNRKQNPECNHFGENSTAKNAGGCSKWMITLGGVCEGLYDHELNKDVDRCADTQRSQDCDGRIPIRTLRLTGRNQSGLKSYVGENNQQDGIQPRIDVM